MNVFCSVPSVKPHSTCTRKTLNDVFGKADTELSTPRQSGCVFPVLLLIRSYEMLPFARTVLCVCNTKAAL